MDRQCHFTPIIATIVPVIGTLVAPLKLGGGRRSAKTLFCDKKRSLTFPGPFIYVIASEEDETSDGIAARGFVNGRGPRPSGRGRDRTVGPYRAEVLSSSENLKIWSWLQ